MTEDLRNAELVRDELYATLRKVVALTCDLSIIISSLIIVEYLGERCFFVNIGSSFSYTPKSVF